MTALKRVRAGLALPLSLLLVGFATAQTPDGSSDRISVDVNLVVLHATVTDRSGRFVSGLHQQDFVIYDDGVPQPITLFRHEDVPVTVGLVVDHSGSMGPKIFDVMAAATTFARASNPADQMFVVNFNERVSFGLPAGVPFTADASQLDDAISRTRTTGRTALYDAVAAGLDHIRKGARDKKVLIVISDGGDNASRLARSQALEAARNSNVIIYTIGLFNPDDPDRNPRLLEALARATGGEAFLPNSSSAVVGICSEIAKDIRSQYTLGYAPPDAAAGVWRKIRVTAKSPHRSRLSVRTRDGYYPAAHPPGSGRAKP
jgi:Ca-activated chloride channel homolog